MIDNIALCCIVILPQLVLQQKKIRQTFEQHALEVVQDPLALHPSVHMSHLSSASKFAFLFSKASSKNLEIEDDPSSTAFLTDFALANWRSKFFIRAKITKRTRICFILVAAILMEEIFLDLKYIIVQIKINNRYITGFKT